MFYVHRSPPKDDLPRCAHSGLAVWTWRRPAAAVACPSLALPYCPGPIQTMHLLCSVMQSNTAANDKMIAPYQHTCRRNKLPDQ